MSKIISLTLAKPIGTIIGLLAVISIAPKSEAMNANIQPSSLQQPAENLHSQIIFRIGDRSYTRREEWQYRRDLRRQQRRWERRNGEYNRGGYNRGEYNRNDGYNRGEYNRNGRYNRGEYNRNDGYSRNR
jgi:hypothetical protein